MKIKYLLILFFLTGCAKIDVEITVEPKKPKQGVIIESPGQPAAETIVKTIPSVDSYPDKPRYRMKIEEEDDFLKHIKKSDSVDFIEYIIHIVGTWEHNRACLWNIAIKYYGNPYEYIMIYQLNSDIIENPDLIYPRQKLKIPILRK